MSGIENIGADVARGDIFQLARTDGRHFAGKHDPIGVDMVETGFRDSLMDSLNDVNNLQRQHEELSVQAVVNPESVDAHDLTIAAAQANLSLNITKNIIDRVIQAYRDITNLR